MLHYWVNNAGINGGRKPFVDLTTSQIEAVVKVNMLGSLLCTSAALKLMKEQRGVKVIGHSHRAARRHRGGGPPTADRAAPSPRVRVLRLARAALASPLSNRTRASLRRVRSPRSLRRRSRPPPHRRAPRARPAGRPRSRTSSTRSARASRAAARPATRRTARRSAGCRSSRSRSGWSSTPRRRASDTCCVCMPVYSGGRGGYLFSGVWRRVGHISACRDAGGGSVTSAHVAAAP